MKKILSICSLIGVISMSAISVHAQPSPTAPSDRMHKPMMCEHKFDPAERAAHLQKTLQLSDEQTAKVKKLLEDNAQQRESIKDKYKPQFEAFRADMKKLHEQTQTQLNGVLTPKQQQALEAQRKSHGRGMCDHDDDKTDQDKHDHH